MGIATDWRSCQPTESIVHWSNDETNDKIPNETTYELITQHLNDVVDKLVLLSSDINKQDKTYVM